MSVAILQDETFGDSFEAHIGTLRSKAIYLNGVPLNPSGSGELTLDGDLLRLGDGVPVDVNTATLKAKTVAQMHNVATDTTVFTSDLAANTVFAGDFLIGNTLPFVSVSDALETLDNAVATIQQKTTALSYNGSASHFSGNVDLSGNELQRVHNVNLQTAGPFDNAGIQWFQGAFNCASIDYAGVNEHMNLSAANFRLKTNSDNAKILMNGDGTTTITSKGAEIITDDGIRLDAIAGDIKMNAGNEVKLQSKDASLDMISNMDLLVSNGQTITATSGNASVVLTSGLGGNGTATLAGGSASVNVNDSAVIIATNASGANISLTTVDAGVDITATNSALTLTGSSILLNGTVEFSAAADMRTLNNVLEINADRTVSDGLKIYGYETLVLKTTPASSKGITMPISGTTTINGGGDAIKLFTSGSAGISAQANSITLTGSNKSLNLGTNMDLSTTSGNINITSAGSCAVSAAAGNPLTITGGNGLTLTTQTGLVSFSNASLTAINGATFSGTTILNNVTIGAQTRFPTISSAASSLGQSRCIYIYTGTPGVFNLYSIATGSVGSFCIVVNRSGGSITLTPGAGQSLVDGLTGTSGTISVGVNQARQLFAIDTTTWYVC